MEFQISIQLLNLKLALYQDLLFQNLILIKDGLFNVNRKNFIIQVKIIQDYKYFNNVLLHTNAKLGYVVLDFNPKVVYALILIFNISSFIITHINAFLHIIKNNLEIRVNMDWVLKISVSIKMAFIFLTSINKHFWII